MLGFLLRLVLLAAGLLFAASLLVAVAFLLVLWGLRAVWATLTGRPVSPLTIRIDPRGGFGRVYRRGPRPARPPSGAPPPEQRDSGDVTDVEPKEPRR